MHESHHQIISTNREESQIRSLASEETQISPSIEEEEAEDEQHPGLKKNASIQVDGDQKAAGLKTSSSLPHNESREMLTPQLPVNGLGSARAKQDSTPTNNKELEQMKVKYKIMERKRMEDRDKLKALDATKIERDKFEITIQKLQRKCQTQSQEIAAWRRQLQESEAKVEEIERADAERGTVAELASLDKEMAEERLETVTAEFESLKEKCEELELEAEITRDENRELTSGMTSEERSSAGWLQIEKENNRLREALVALRSMTQETEVSLKGHVKELEDDLSGYEALISEHEKTKVDLAASRTAIQTLKENLDAVDSQELLVAQLNEEKDVLMEEVTELSKQVMRLNEEADVSKQLQEAQDEAERMLQEDYDDVRAFARERDEKTKDQAKTIDDLEYTLLKFKEVLHGLQSDLEELRANKQINETETNELNAKSRAVMDLNLRLQSTATRTQTKKLESELNQIIAEDTASYLAILQEFVPETFKNEKDPIIALLRFKRIASKASLLRHTVEETICHPPDSVQSDTYTALDITEKLWWVSSCCSRCHNFMKGCSVEDYSKFDAASYELEPVERALDACIDSAKRNQMDSARCAQDLQRMIALLSDLAEKTVPSIPEAFSDIFTGRSGIMQLYSENVGLQLGLIKDSLGNKVVLREEDEDLPRFSQEIQRLIDRTRTNRVVAGKVLRAVDEHKSRSMSLAETSLIPFEQAESLGKELSEFSRFLGEGLRERLNDDTAGDESIKFDDVSNFMQELARDWLRQSSSSIPEASHVLEIVGDMLSAFQSKLEGLLTIASDMSNFSELERHPAPWTVRAKTLKEQKIVDTQMEEQLRKLQSEAHEQNMAASAKDKALEEQHLKIELLEARSKDANDHAVALQKLEKELVEVVSARDKSMSELEVLRKEKQALAQRYDDANAKSAMVNQNIVAGDPGAAATSAAKDESRSLQLADDIELLKEEIENLQSAVRFLKAENHRLFYPVSPASLAATNHTWLEANPLPKSGRVTNERGLAVAAEAKDVFSRLLEVSSTLKPLQLQSPSGTSTGGKQSSWRPIKKTPRYLVSHQREEFEKWTEWKDDLIQRAGKGKGRINK